MPKVDPSLLEELIADLKIDEGYRAKPYADSVGKLTIGVGRNLTDNGLRDSEIRFMLINDIADALTTARSIFDAFDSYSLNRQRAIVNLIFNLGSGSFLKFEKTIAAIRDLRWGDAADRLTQSLWFKQVQPSRSTRIVNAIRNG